MKRSIFSRILRWFISWSPTKGVTIESQRTAGTRRVVNQPRQGFETREAARQALRTKDKIKVQG